MRERGFLLYTFSMQSLKVFFAEKELHCFPIFYAINTMIAKLNELREQYDNELKIW